MYCVSNFLKASYTPGACLEILLRPYHYCCVLEGCLSTLSPPGHTPDTWYCVSLHFANYYRKKCKVWISVYENNPIVSFLNNNDNNNDNCYHEWASMLTKANAASCENGSLSDFILMLVSSDQPRCSNRIVSSLVIYNIWHKWDSKEI